METRENGQFCITNMRKQRNFGANIGKMKIKLFAALIPGSPCSTKRGYIGGHF